MSGTMNLIVDMLQRQRDQARKHRDELLRALDGIVVIHSDGPRGKRTRAMGVEDALSTARRIRQEMEDEEGS